MSTWLPILPHIVPLPAAGLRRSHSERRHSPPPLIFATGLISQNAVSGPLYADSDVPTRCQIVKLKAEVTILVSICAGISSSHARDAIRQTACALSYDVGYELL